MTTDRCIASLPWMLVPQSRRRYGNVTLVGFCLASAFCQ